MSRKKVRFSKRVIVALLVAVAVFTVTMIGVFCATGAVPDALIYSFYGFVGAEAGVLGMIKRAEEKNANADETPVDE